MKEGKAAVTIDLDTLGSDLSLGGAPAEELRRVSYERALPRLLELLDGAGIKATFFVIGTDAADPARARLIGQLAAAGHEAANHSFSHDRTLPLKPAGEILADILEADRLIAAAAGRRPRGFRSPGALLTPALLRALREAGYAYDSSLNASLPYNLAKAAYGLLHRGATPALRAAGAPDAPYYPDETDVLRRARPGARGPAEFPLTRMPVLDLPFMNYFLLRLGPLAPAAARLTAGRRPFVNFVLHDHEFLETGDLPPGLRARGMTAAWLGRSLSSRLRATGAALAEIKRGHSFDTLEAYAENLAGGAGRN